MERKISLRLGDGLDVIKEGDEIRVKLIGIDKQTGKFKLSHKVLIPKPEGYVEPERKPFDRNRENNHRNGDNQHSNNFEHNHQNNTDHTRPVNNINRNNNRY